MAVTVKQLEGLCRFDSIDALHRRAIGPRSMPTIRLRAAARRLGRSA